MGCSNPEGCWFDSPQRLLLSRECGGVPERDALTLTRSLTGLGCCRPAWCERARERVNGGQYRKSVFEWQRVRDTLCERRPFTVSHWSVASPHGTTSRPSGNVTNILERFASPWQLSLD